MKIHGKLTQARDQQEGAKHVHDGFVAVFSASHRYVLDLRVVRWNWRGSGGGCGCSGSAVNSLLLGVESLIRVGVDFRGAQNDSFKGRDDERGDSPAECQDSRYVGGVSDGE